MNVTKKKNCLLLLHDFRQKTLLLSTQNEMNFLFIKLYFCRPFNSTFTLFLLVMETFIESPTFKHFSRYTTLFCVIGCTIQLLDATVNYLSFKVRNEVSFEYPDSIELPEIDISLPLVSVMNISALYERYPKKMVEVCSFYHGYNEQFTSKINATSYPILCSWVSRSALQSSALLSDFVTVKDIEQLTSDVRTQIHGLWLHDDNQNSILNKYCSVKRFFSSTCLYIRISCLNNSKPLHIEAQNLLTVVTYFASIVESLKTKYGLKFSHFNSSIEPNFLYYTTIPYSQDGQHINIIQYRKIVTSLLEYPYETKCVNYDRESVLMDCFNNRLLALKSPSLHPSAVLPCGKYRGTLSFTKDQSESLPIYKSCYEKFRRPQCLKIDYEIKHEIATEKVSQNYGILLIQPSKLAGTNYSSNPKQIFSEYLIFAGSILGMWFGVSIIDRLTISMVTGIKIYRKKVAPETDTRVNVSPVTEPGTEQDSGSVNVTR